MKPKTRLSVTKQDQAQKPIILLGWQLHSMNPNFKMTCMTGGDDYFGPNLDAASVRNTRASYAAECPNTGKRLSNLSFSLEMENEIMGKIPNDSADPRDAAKTWLDGVTTKDGGDAVVAVTAALQ